MLTEIPLNVMKNVISKLSEIWERFLMVVIMLTEVFWVVILCGLVGGYQHFGGTYHLHDITLKMEVIQIKCWNQLQSTSWSRRWDMAYKDDTILSKFFIFVHDIWLWV
jgi:hypothetical protein